MSNLPQKRKPARSDLLQDVRALIQSSREQVARSVNSALVLLYWHIGRRIRQDILNEKRAEYGKQILQALSAQLLEDFGRGYGERNLAYMVKFAEAFPDEKILHALCAKLGMVPFPPPNIS